MELREMKTFLGAVENGTVYHGVLLLLGNPVFRSFGFTVDNLHPLATHSEMNGVEGFFLAIDGHALLIA
jgi:hypothetical protein